MTDDDVGDESMENTAESVRQSRHPAATDATPDIAVETVFDVLADPRRLVVLATLRAAADESISMQTLLTECSMHPRLSVSSDELAVAFHHTVLPKLAVTGLIKCDTHCEIIRYVGHPWVEIALDMAADWEK